MDADLLSATLDDLNKLISTATSDIEREHLVLVVALLKDPDGDMVHAIADRLKELSRLQRLSPLFAGA